VTARVAVVDDEENIRFLVESALQLHGFATAPAASGTAALALVDSFRPDLIVLDVMLPDIDGFTVLRRMRDAGTTAPVIFLSARDTTDDRVHGLTIGGDDYLVKPFAVAELVARVKLSLKRAGNGDKSRTPWPALTWNSTMKHTESHELAKSFRFRPPNTHCSAIS
jgi:two-component system, OmpR family, response regulator